MSERSRTRRTLGALTATVVLTLAACGAPSSAIAPNLIDPSPLGAVNAAASLRPITALAAKLLEPLSLAGLRAASRNITLESGEVRVEQSLVDDAGLEWLTTQSTPSGVLRALSRSYVPLEGGALTDSALVSRAILHLATLGLPLGSGTPLISVAGDRRIVAWERVVNGVPVIGDGTRVALSASGALVGISTEEAELAPLTQRSATAAQAKAAAQTLVPSGATLGGAPKLGWVAPGIDAGDEEDLRAPRQLAWRLRGTLGDGTPFELHLSAASLALIGWDWAR
jgi:hypothetical protein